MDRKTLNISFAPGALDDFNGTQEELDSLVEEIKDALEKEIDDLIAEHHDNSVAAIIDSITPQKPTLH